MKGMSKALPCVALSGLYCLTAGAAILYDGSLGTTPDQQGWSFAQLPWGQATQSASGGATTIDTTQASGNQAGYTPVNPSALDRQTGYVVSVELRVLSENHDGTPDRAGFSLIVLSSDQRGIELGFWPGEVWAQNTGFTHGERAGYDTTQPGVRYDLTVQGDNYSLVANQQPLLTGALRQYSTGLLIDPYQIPNLLFLGDDTTSAAAQVEIRRVAVGAVPEPNATGLVALSLIGLVWFRRARSGAN